MPTNFLDLPRELRDYIYREALVSPTGHVVPIVTKCIETRPKSRYTGLKTRSHKTHHPVKATQRLLLLPCAASWMDRPVLGRCPVNKAEYHIMVGASCFPLAGALPLASAICLVSRQVHAETKDTLYHHNTFCFANGAEAVWILKYMGQATSTRIERARLYIDMQPERWDGPTVGKALGMLASRCRRGALREVELYVDKLNEYLSHPQRRQFRFSEDRYINHSLNDVLARSASSTWSVSDKVVVRRIIFEHALPGSISWPLGDVQHRRYLENEIVWRYEEIKEIAYEMQGVWDGDVTFNGQLIWKQSSRRPDKYDFEQIKPSTAREGSSSIGAG